MTTSPIIDATNSIADVVARHAAEERRSLVEVVQELYYRALFDRYLGDTDVPGERDQRQRRELLEVQLRQTKNAVHEVVCRASDVAARTSIAPAIEQAVAKIA